MRVCSVDGCDRKYDSHGLCHTHSRRLKNTGTVEPRDSINKGKKCSVDGCDRDSHQTGRCGMHYARFFKYGTTDYSGKRKDWKGTKLLSPDGVEHTITISLRAFCMEHNLQQQNMFKVIKGQRAHHSLWSCPDAGFVPKLTYGPRRKAPYRACSVEGCEGDSKTKDICERHSQRLRKFGRTHNVRRVPGDAALDSKKCAKCGDTKPIARFYPMGVYADGITIKHRTKCNDCCIAEATECHHENRTRKLEGMRKRREDLNDTYVNQMLGVKNPPQALIELKRSQLLVTRQLRKMVKTPAN
jgi:hypothetical protein